MYTFVPQDFLRGLFGASGLDLPTGFAKEELYGNDSIPSDIDPSTISYLGEFLLASPALFVSNPPTTEWSIGGGLISRSITPGTAGGQGWVTVETVFIGLNTDFTPSGRFPVYSRGTPRIGYDAAVCVQKYEPWIVEAHNTPTGSYILRIAGKGDGNTTLPPSGNIRGARLANTRYLNTTGKGDEFTSAHNRGSDRMVDINSDQGNPMDDRDIPSPSVGPVVPRVQHTFSDCDPLPRSFL